MTPACMFTPFERKGAFLGGIKLIISNKWDRVYKNGPIQFNGRQPLKIEVIWFVETDDNTSDFLKAVLHKIYLVCSWILCLKCTALISKY